MMQFTTVIIAANIHHFFLFKNKVYELKDLYSRLTDLNNLYEAFLRCKNGVDWKESVQRYECHVFENLIMLKTMLENQTYRQKPFFEFELNERGKVRHIKSMHISDRVLQRALCDFVLNPELTPYLIYDNGASMKGKGIDFSRRRLKTHLTKYYREHGKNGYVLLIDFSKYFDNIPHDVLKIKLAEKIHDEKVMNLVCYLIDTFEGEKGVGIGSQLSQTVGIYYPTELDQFCKTVKSCKYYGRYMDDTYIIHHDKEFLKKLLEEYRVIAARLGIVINKKKTQIVGLKNGFKFLQMRYRLTDSGRVLVIPVRKSVTRERQRLKRFYNLYHQKQMTKEQVYEQYRSWRGNIIKYDCYRSVRNTDLLLKELFGGKNEKPTRKPARKRNGTYTHRGTNKRACRRTRCSKFGYWRLEGYKVL